VAMHVAVVESRESAPSASRDRGARGSSASAA
jgi:hypothetical protein